MNRASAVAVLLPAADARGVDELREYVERFSGMDSVSTVWLRDLPAVRRGHPDQGPGVDPFVLATSVMTASRHLHNLGIAVSPAGARHYAALARTVTSICDITGMPFRLGVGAGEPSSPWTLPSTDTRSRSTALVEYVESLCGLVDGVGEADLELTRPFKADSVPRVWIATSDVRAVERLSPRLEGWMTWQSRPESIRETVRTIRTWEAQPRLAVTVNVWFDVDAVRPEHVVAPVQALRGKPADVAAYVNAHLEFGVDEVIINPCSPAPGDGSQLSLLHDCLSFLDAKLRTN